MPVASALLARRRAHLHLQRRRACSSGCGCACAFGDGSARSKRGAPAPSAMVVSLAWMWTPVPSATAVPLGRRGVCLVLRRRQSRSLGCGRACAFGKDGPDRSEAGVPLSAMAALPVRRRRTCAPTGSCTRALRGVFSCGWAISGPSLFAESGRGGKPSGRSRRQVSARCAAISLLWRRDPAARRLDQAAQCAGHRTGKERKSQRPLRGSSRAHIR